MLFKRKRKNAIWILLSVVMLLLANSSLAASKLYFVHNDHLGTPQVLTDENQQVVWEVESQTPFGITQINEDPDGDGNNVELNLRFPGQYFDKETNTSYNYYRTYDQTLGRYIQSDPIGLGDGPNTYNYVHGNPIKSADPTGKATTLEFAFAGSIFLGGYCLIDQPGCQRLGNAVYNLIHSDDSTNVEASAISNTNKCLQFYRGDYPNKTEFWAHESGQFGQDLLDSNPREVLMQQHTSSSEYSPFISITPDFIVAEHFGEVYSITLPPGMAFPNPYNMLTLPNTNIPENEWLVPIHIPAKYVNNPNCTCE